MQLAGGARELIGDAAGERVAGLEQRAVDGVSGADHLRDGDRLAERTAQAEERGGGDS